MFFVCLDTSLSSVFCACGCDSAGLRSCEKGWHREENLFFSLIQQSVCLCTFSSSPFSSLVKAILDSLSWHCRASLMAREWGELLSDLVGKYPPKVPSKAPLKAEILLAAVPGPGFSQDGGRAALAGAPEPGGGLKLSVSLKLLLGKTKAQNFSRSFQLLLGGARGSPCTGALQPGNSQALLSR